jgi:hypothetical protein
MIQLREIVRSLEADVYSSLEKALINSQADNFLQLLQAYRNTAKSDEEIRVSLDISKNSYYALKSRLHDKVEDVLGGDVTSSRTQVIDMLERIPETVYGQAPEVADTFLNKLARDLLRHDMHGDLLAVYSALKKLHLYSDRYFHYSQLFNKHAAYSLSLEKADELMGSFNRYLTAYILEPSAEGAQSLRFIKSSIHDHAQLNNSRQIRMICNTVRVQMILFAHIREEGLSVADMIDETEKILDEMPDSLQLTYWQTVISFLRFMHNHESGQLAAAKADHDALVKDIQNLPLLSHVVLTPLFLTARIAYAQRMGIALTADDASQKFLLRSSDRFSQLQVELYTSLCHYFSGDTKQAVRQLNGLINDFSFSDAFQAEIDVKLTLAYLYIRQKDHEHASGILKKLARKIKATGRDVYSHVLRLIKLLDRFPASRKELTPAQQDEFTLFKVRNNNEYRVMAHLLPELEKTFGEL